MELWINGCLGLVGMLSQHTIDWGLISKSNLFVLLLEAGSLRSGGWLGWVLGRPLFRAADCQRLHMVGRERGNELSSDSYETAVPSGGPTLVTSFSPEDHPKATLPSTITLGDRISK